MAPLGEMTAAPRDLRLSRSSIVGARLSCASASVGSAISASAMRRMTAWLALPQKYHFARVAARHEACPASARSHILGRPTPPPRLAHLGLQSSLPQMLGGATRERGVLHALRRADAPTQRAVGWSRWRQRSDPAQRSAEVAGR